MPADTPKPKGGDQTPEGATATVEKANDSSKETFQLDPPGQWCVVVAGNEVIFDTDSDGYFSPSNDQELAAMTVLALQPTKRS